MNQQSQAEPDSLNVAKGRRRLLAWFWRLPVIAALAGGGYGAFRAYKIHFGKLAPAAEPMFVPITPQRIAGLSNFAQVWDAAEFVAQGIPAIAICLPQAIDTSITINGAHYAAFSRICTHLGCLVSLNTNIEAIAVGFNYRSSTPALTCPCHLSVFLPTSSGKAVSGPAVKPLPRIALEERDGTLYAVSIELAQS